MQSSDAAHEELLLEWANRDHHRGKGFVSDGVIDRERWNQAMPRILWLVKEAPSDANPPVDWDVRTIIRDHAGAARSAGDNPRTVLPNKGSWRAAFCCFAAEFAITPLPAYPNSREDWNRVANAFLGSAWVNVKKSNGQIPSNFADLYTYVQKDGDLLKRQISLIAPTLIICGGTWPLVRDLFPKATQIYDRIWRDDFLIVDFYHPGFRAPYVVFYHAFASLLQNWKRQREGALRTAC